MAASIDFTSLRADYILVSHGHEDHTADLLDLASQTGALVISNHEIVTWLSSQGYDKVRGMNIGGSWNSEGMYIKMVQAIHSSSFPDGSYAGTAAGFVIHGGGDTIYFAGDTSLSRDMELIASEFVLDAALLPLGDTYTMGPQDAVKAARMLACKKVVGMHFDTFDPIRIDHRATRELFRFEGVELILPTVGDEVEI